MRYIEGATTAVVVATVCLAVIGAPMAAAQGIGGGGGGIGPGTGPGTGGGIGVQQDTNTTADAVYLREDGSGVLVYESDDVNGTFTYGADMTSGLLHMVANGTSDANLTGDLSLEAEPTSFSANGSFETQESVQSLKNLDLSVTSETTDTNSEFDLELESSVAGGFALFLPRVSTQGQIVTEADNLTTSGTATFTSLTGSSSSVREVRRFDLTETADGYSLDGRERKIVEPTPSFGGGDFSSGTSGGFERTTPQEKWGTRERALETLRETYTSFAENGSGSAELSLESYSFRNVTVESEFGPSETRSLVDVEYSVEYTGVQESIATQIANNVSDGNVSQETADNLAQGIRNLTINRIRYASVSGENGTELNWTVDIANYNEALIPLLELTSEASATGAGTAGPGSASGIGAGTASPFSSGGFLDGLINRSRRQIAAAEESGLVSRVEWSADIEPPSSGGGLGGLGGSGGGGTASVNADVSYTTENWGAYVDALESRDLTGPARSSFNLTVATTGSGIEGDLTWNAEGEEIAEGYRQTLNVYEEALQSAEDSGEMGDIDASFVRNLNNSEFRVAKMDASLDDAGSWNLEAGAAFGNGSALASAIEDATGIRVTEVVGTQEDGGTVTYVKADPLVDETSESAVRSLDQVDDETTVNMPGEWDRDFPTMDTAAAAEYLGVETGGDGSGEDGGGGSPLPGFTPLAALVALVALAAGFAYRNRDG